jgi:hypothetical protein
MMLGNTRVVSVAVAILIAAASGPHAQAVKPTQLRVTAEPLTNWGSTFHALEQKAGRVTTRFADGSAVAERGMDGRISARLLDAVGNETAALRVEQNGPMRLDVFGVTKLNTARRPGVIPTLSWANEQAYALSKASGTVEWHGEVLRGKQEPAIQEIEVEFDGGFIAKTTRKPAYFVTFLSLYGTQVGWVRYHPKERQLVFQFPGLAQNVFTQDSLKPVGGWKFTPTMGWMHVQALAFYEFHSAVKTRQAVKADWLMKPEPNWLQKAWEAVFPTLQAQDGCTYLHHLDGTVYRPCCDSHDRCYVKNGCNMYSWLWPFSWQWQCVPCNIRAFVCFQGANTPENYVWVPTP